MLNFVQITVILFQFSTLQEWFYASEVFYLGCCSHDKPVLWIGDYGHRERFIRWLILRDRGCCDPVFRQLISI